MARRNHIVVSDDELERLEEVRDDVFKTDSAPYGEVIDLLLIEYGYPSTE